MDTVTYPDAAVIATVKDYFAPVRLNTADPGPAEKDLLRRSRFVWTPTLIFLDHHEIEVRRSVGFLPPADFLAELALARAMAALLHGQFAESFQVLRHIVAENGAAAAAPEALYWAGVAGYRRDGKPDELRVQWQELRQRFPDSVWWTKASFVAG